MTFFISDLHKELRLARRRGAVLGDNAPKGTHKTYPRMDQVELPEPTEVSCTLDAALRQRNSSLPSTPAAPLSLQDLGTLFGLALRRHGGSHRRHYPSGGYLYPIETYLVTPQGGELGGAAYHYNPTTHALEKLWQTPKDLTIERLLQHPEDIAVSGIVVFSSMWDRSSTKYGDFSYMLGLLECGHMSENILLMSTALGLQARPMLSFDDTAIETLLDLDNEQEQVVLTVALAKPADHS